MSQLETCQHCSRAVAVDGRGRTEDHSIVEPDPARPWNDWHCHRSGHPSREELTRRKASRVARLRALVTELAPETHAALDAYLLRDSEASERFSAETLASIAPARLAEFRRAALFEHNRRNRARRRWPVDLVPLESDGEIRQATWACVFCGERLGGNRIVGHRKTYHDYVARHFRDHLTQCALEYLAGCAANRSPETRPGGSECRPFSM